jgi:hypothetical protein
MPLGGDVGAGGAARRGNIGAGPDGHILDHYVVPCPEGPVELFVDMYHCVDEAGQLSEAEIERAMADLRIFLRAPEDSTPAVVTRAHRALREMGVNVPECRHLFQLLFPPEEELPAWRAIASVYFGSEILSLYENRSSLAPGADPSLAAAVESNAQTSAAVGMVRHYRRLVAAGYTNLQHPQLERLAAIPEEQLLEEVNTRVNMCQLEAMTPGIRLEIQD